MQLVQLHAPAGDKASSVLHPYFEVHVGIPSEYATFIHSSKNGWATKSFSGFLRPNEGVDHDEHDVEAGASVVMTRKYDTMGDLEGSINDGIEVLKLYPGCRLEVEAVLFKTGYSAYRGPLFSSPRYPKDSSLRQLRSVPRFESHISLTTADARRFRWADVVNDIRTLTADLHELAYTPNGQSAIATFFFSDFALMEAETLRISEQLQEIPHFDFEQKITMEQILLCLAISEITA